MLACSGFSLKKGNKVRGEKKSVIGHLVIISNSYFNLVEDV